jgi:hypothetical protein
MKNHEKITPKEEKEKKERAQHTHNTRDQKMKAFFFLVCLSFSFALSPAHDLSSHPLLAPLHSIKRAKFERSGETRNIEGIPSCPVFLCANETQPCGLSYGDSFFGGTASVTGIFFLSLNGMMKSNRHFLYSFKRATSFSRRFTL